VNRWHQFAGIVLFVVLCVPLVQWTWHVFIPAEPPVAVEPKPTSANVNRNAVADLFSKHPAVIATTTKFQLNSVVLAQKERDNVAIMQINDNPAQAVRVGAQLVPGVTVSEVHGQYVLLLEDGISTRVELPANVKSQSVTSIDAPLPTQLIPVQSVAATTPQTPSASSNMVVRISPGTGGLPEIGYAPASISSNVPTQSTGAVAQQLVPSRNAMRASAGNAD
jgi:general secretion pathway protein C